MSGLTPLQSSGFRVDSLPVATDSAARSAGSADSAAASWLGAGAEGGSGSLHVSQHDAGLDLDRIEQEFLAALCADAPR